MHAYTQGDVKRGAPGFYHLVDSTKSNQYRAMRIINETTNLLFAEFTDLSDWNFDGALFTEYFDMTSDPWQIHNIADTAPASEVAELRATLHKLWTCKATDCP